MDIPSIANFDDMKYTIEELPTGTMVLMEFDSVADPSIHDVVSEIQRSDVVFIDGRYFKCSNATFDRRVDGMSYWLSLELQEQDYKKVGVK